MELPKRANEYCMVEFCHFLKERLDMKSFLLIQRQRQVTLEFNERHQIGKLATTASPPFHMDLQKALNVLLLID
jgi:hypothetical protein